MQENEEVFLSVIVPIYRVEKYLRECIDSILEQSYKDIELILVDDGSDDSCPQICDDCAETDSRIKVIHKENGGLSSARNAGMMIAKGKYVWFVDADDWIEDDCVNSIRDKIQKYLPDILMFDADIVNETNQDFHRTNYMRKGKIIPDVLFAGKELFQKYYLKDAYRSSVCLNIFSQQYLKKHHLTFLENYAHEDEDFTFRAIVLAEKVLYIDKNFYIRRYRDNSLMTSIFHEKQISDFLQIMKNNTKFVAYIEDEDFQNVYDRYLYDRINLLIDRIKQSDIEEKTFWYKNVEEYFLGYILKDKDHELSKKLMALEVLTHVQETAQSTGNLNIFDEKIKTQLFCSWHKDVKDKIKNCMEDDTELCLGIYGTGKHTSWLFPVFKEIADEKRQKMVFIDSVKGSYTDQFKGYDVINVSDIEQNTLVIISSFFMQDEIYETIRSLKIPCTIIKIYD